MKKLLLSFFILLTGTFSFGSHIIGGFVNADCIGNNQYILTLGLYEDCGSSFQPSNPQTLNITSSCGNMTVQATNTVYQFDTSMFCGAMQGQTICNGGTLPGFYYHEWQVMVTLPPCADWEISYTSCCYGSSTNLAGQPSYFFSTTLDNSTGNCSTPSNPTNLMIPLACLNDTLCFDPGFSLSSNDSVVYHLENVWTNSGASAYNPGFSGANPIPGISIQPATGAFCVFPTQTGNYVINIASKEYENGILVATGNYTFTLYTINCSGSNNAPQSNGISNITGNTGYMNGEIEVCAGSNLCFDVSFSDPDVNDTLTFGSNLLNEYPNASISYTGVNPILASVCIPNISNSSILHFGVSDDFCPIGGQANQSVVISVNGSGLNLTDSQVCWGDSVIYNTANVANWSVLYGDFSSLSCTNCSTQVISPNQTTAYYVEMNTGCGQMVYDTLIVSVYQDAYSLSDTVAGTCGDYVIVSGTNDITWYFQNGSFSGDSLPSSMLNQGWNTVLVEHGISNCMTYDTVHVFYDNSSIDLLLSDTLICVAGVVGAQVAGNYPPGNMFDWNAFGQSIQNGSSSESFMVSISGWITVLSYNDYCVHSDSAYITLDTLSSSTGNIIGNNNVQAMATETYLFDLGQGINYNWSVSGGTLISGQGTNTVDVMWGTDPTGILSIAYSSNGNCTYQDSVTVQISAVNGMKDNTKDQLNIYPNPVSDVLHLFSMGEGMEEIHVYSADGRLIWAESMKGITTKNINVAFWANGVYYLSNEKGQMLGRFVKQ